MKILFFGTPEFAVRILDSLIVDGHEIVGVITQTDKPKGRGNTMTPPPVKVYAVERGIPYYQPKTLRCEESVSLIKDIAPDIIIVAAYGKILPADILAIPRYGCICVHGSLLPAYRGAAPVQRCIMNGEKKTGITLMYMDEGCDTGCMIDSGETVITEDMNCGELFDKLGDIGAELLRKNLPLIENGTAKKIKQDDTLSNYASKIEKSELVLDFSQSAESIHNKIRGVYPYLVCGCTVVSAKGEKHIRIAKASFDKTDSGLPYGTVISADVRDGIKVACGVGTLTLLELIPEGKSKMSAADYVRGRQIASGDILK